MRKNAADKSLNCQAISFTAAQMSLFINHITFLSNCRCQKQTANLHRQVQAWLVSKTPVWACLDPEVTHVVSADSERATSPWRKATEQERRSLGDVCLFLPSPRLLMNGLKVNRPTVQCNCVAFMQLFKAESLHPHTRCAANERAEV